MSSNPRDPASPVDRDLSPIAPAIDPEQRRREQRALAWTTLAAAAAIIWIVMPVGIGILLGTLLAFTVEPLFERLKPRLGERWAALTSVIAATLVFAGTLSFISWLFVARGTLLTRDLLTALGPGGAASRVLDAIGRLTSRVGISPADLTNRVRALAETAAERAALIAAAIASATATSLLTLFFAMLSMHFILRRWGTVSERIQETLPLRPSYTAELLAEFRRVGRTTLLGTVVTGIAQGLLATFGYWITGVPEPVFFGVLTAVASLIPAVGTLIVWVPVGVVVLLTGHPARGILELVWGTTMVVGLSDYVIRPRLIGGEREPPALVTFVGLFGGVEVFGLKGLIIGPVLLSLAIAVIRLYANEAKERLQAR